MHSHGYKLSFFLGPYRFNGLVHFLNIAGPSLTKVVYAYFDRISYAFIHSNCFVLFHWLLGFPSFPGLLNPWCLVWGCAGRTPSRGCWTFASSYGTGGLFGAKMGLAVGLSAAAAGDLFWTRPGAQALTRCELRSEKHFHRRPALQAISLPASYMYWWVCHCWFLGLERNENCKKNSIDINVYKCAIPCHFAKSSLVILCLCCSIFVSRGVKKRLQFGVTMRDHARPLARQQAGSLVRSA